MCVIAICDRLLTNEEFENCEKSNPDGWGVAVVRKRLLKDKIFGTKTPPIHVNKGNVSGIDGHAEYIKIMEEFVGCTHVVHFRFTSVGKTCPELTHPFALDMETLCNDDLVFDTWCSVLFHNGHFDQWAAVYIALMANSPDKILDGEVSDTKVLAWAMTLLKNKHGINSVRSALEKLDDKYVLLNPNGTIDSFGHFFASDDKLIRFSNMSYARTRNTHICAV